MKRTRLRSLSDKRRAQPAKPRKPIARKSKVKPRNPKRRAKEFERAYGGEDRLAWLKARPCVVSNEYALHIDAVHVANGGVSRKADAKWTVPMRADLHRELHQIGIGSFQILHCCNLRELAEYTEAAWQAELAGRQERDA